MTLVLLSMSLASPALLATDLQRAQATMDRYLAEQMLAKTEAGARAVHLLGLTVSNLTLKSLSMKPCR